MLQIGDIQIHFVLDAYAKVDGGGAFGVVPRVLWGRVMPYDADNLIPSMYMGLLVKVGGRNILIDTGLGGNLTEKQQANWHMERPLGHLLDGLARLGLTPGDIDTVINTHLHADHVGWNVTVRPDMPPAPVFTNAEYLTQRREYEDALRLATNERTRATYIPVNFQPLVESGQMRLLDGDTEFAPGVRGVITCGHTPAHMSIVFENGGQVAAFLCDLASYAPLFERIGWVAAYDIEPLETIETKRMWQKWALDTNAILIFPHDQLRPAGRLVQDESSKLSLESIDVTFA